MSVLLRGCVVALCLLGAFLILLAYLYSLPLCGYPCQGDLIFILLMLVAVGGFTWTVVRNRPNAAIKALMWFAAALLFGVVLPTM